MGNTHATWLYSKMSKYIMSWSVLSQTRDQSSTHFPQNIYPAWIAVSHMINNGTIKMCSIRYTWSIMEALRCVA